MVPPARTMQVGAERERRNIIRGELGALCLLGISISHLQLSCHWDQIQMIEDPLSDPITHDFPCESSHGESSCPLSLDKRGTRPYESGETSQMSECVKLL